MKKTEGSKSNEGKEEENEAMKIWDCGSPLYDAYEIASVGHVIERHSMAFPFLNGGSRRLTNHVSRSSTLIPSTQEVVDSRKAKGSSMVGCFGCFGKRGERMKREKKILRK
ncbi:unnamed protein product [Camellia sinensis]